MIWFLKVFALQHTNTGAFDNAIRILLAAGGSTNAIIHLIAIAGRAASRLILIDSMRYQNQPP
ncbi:MAG: hypothetical protein CM1200mP39_17190 [Dehalococcoidia bacterium]|nr:MAG: hypothetical protein CM1200mP39_17190 [Dehalococcoidia bacterium]